MDEKHLEIEINESDLVKMFELFWKGFKIKLITWGLFSMDTILQNDLILNRLSLDIRLDKIEVFVEKYCGFLLFRQTYDKTRQALPYKDKEVHYCLYSDKIIKIYRKYWFLSQNSLGLGEPNSTKKKLSCL